VRPRLRSLAAGIVVLVAAGSLAAGCGGGSDTSSTAPPPRSDTKDGGGTPTGDGSGGVQLVKVGDFRQPVYVAQPPGEKHDLFVVEQTGRILVVRDGRTVAKPFLDISDQVSCCGEQGLLSVAFSPDYASSGRFYIDYTNRAGDTRVVEYRRSRDPLVADPKSRREVLRVDQPYPNHNGGLVLFGPDRLLYIGLGDGGSEDDPHRNGQSLGTLLGKILRIDPRPSNGRPYTVPSSNPFADRRGARPEIYSYGLRNPWRFSFDRLTDAMSIGDVGQNEFEEVDLVPRGEGSGANFGWSAYEGFARFNEDQTASNAVPPVFVYSHDSGCSITGGYVVRDPGLPSLYGRYLYGDYCAGELHSFTARPGRRATDDRALGLTVPSLSSFGEDNAGHVYATSLEGPAYRLVASQP
jgi:glucose/arabinose dehydrogenase